MYLVPLVLVYLWLFFVFCAMACVRRNDFILREKNKVVELDAWMKPILFLITMNALSSRSGDLPQLCHGEAILFTTWFPRFSYEAFNLVLV